MQNNLPNLTNTKFKIGIKGVHWRSLPVYTISIDSEIKIVGEFDLPSGEVELVEFDTDLDLTNIHELEIRLEHKYHHDTVVDKNNNIAKDMFITVESIEINGDELGVYKKTGKFVPDDQSMPTQPMQLTLSMPGSYKLPFMIMAPDTYE